MSIFIPRPNEINAINPKGAKKLNPMGNIDLIGAPHNRVDFGGAVKMGAYMTEKAKAVLEKISAVLSTERREKMPKKEFAIPSKKNEKNPEGEGAYPIPDKAHARNALARVSQHGSPAEKAKVRAKVHAKYPDIGEKTAEILLKLSKHMPHFEDQDRPEKAKEVFHALKEEHPEYSAGKKARIANAVAAGTVKH